MARGTFGIVFQLVYKDNTFAIKTLRPCRTAPAVAVQEIVALKACRHVNVVELLHVVRASDEIALCLAWVDAVKLKDILGSADDHVVRCYMLGLFMALERVHALGYIHLDVKPGNLLFDLKAKHLRLADFGLARQARDAYGCQYGTSGYRSPDNLLNKSTCASSDVWAAGIVLLAFLTQRERVWLSTDGKARELYNVIALCGSEAFAELAGTTCSFDAVGSNAECVVEPARWDEVTQPSVRLDWPEPEGVHAALTSLAQNCLRVRPTSRWTAAECIKALQKLHR